MLEVLLCCLLLEHIHSHDVERHLKNINHEQTGVIKVKSLPSLDMAATGSNISRLRESAGISVQMLRELLGLASTQAIYRWQRGETMPTLDNLIALSAILEVSPCEIIICKEIKYDH